MDDCSLWAIHEVFWEDRLEFAFFLVECDFTSGRKSIEWSPIYMNQCWRRRLRRSPTTCWMDEWRSTEECASVLVRRRPCLRWCWKYAGHFALRDNLFVRTMRRQKPDENGKASCWPVVKTNLMLFSHFIHNLFEVVLSDWRVRSGYFSHASSDACHHPCSIRKSIVSEWREDNDATRPLSLAIIWVLADECGLPHELGN